MENLILDTIKIYIEEINGVESDPIEAKATIPWMEVYYIEEYKGEILPTEIPITVLNLYNGTSICVIEPYEKMSKAFKDFKASQANNNFFNN